MVSNTSKTLLRNIIRHTDTHNRLVEESEMWQAHRSRKRRLESHKREERSVSSEPDRKRSSIKQVSQAHMDHESSVSDTDNTLYWKRKLQAMEEKDPDRWGHAGYKELHPEQFVTDSDRSRSSSPVSGDDRRRSKSKAKKKKLEKHQKKRKKEKHKEKKHKKHKSRRKESPEYEWVPKSANTSPDKAH